MADQLAATPTGLMRRAAAEGDRSSLARLVIVALTIEAAAMAGVPLAGTNWIPGKNGF